MMRHLKAVWTFRHFLMALVRLDLRLRYKRSVLGVGWSLLNPISLTIVFTLVFSNLLGADPHSYVPFLLLGMAVWGFIRECMVSGSQALVANESYIRQSPLPYGLYSLRIVLGQAIHSSITFVVAVVAAVYLVDSYSPLTILWAVFPSLVLVLIFGWAVATICSFVNVFVQDTAQILEIVAQVGFFLTPIMYRPEVLVDKGLAWLVKINPANLFLELIRTPLLTGEPPPMKLYVYATILTLGLVGVASTMIARLHKKVVFRL
jgi:lipopolysaccharide transport system permease protein